MSNREEAQDLQLAFSLHRNEKFSEAAKVYRQIIKRNSRNIHALHSLGVIEAANGNLTEAAGLMSRSLLIQPTNIQFIENYATVLCRLEDYETALEISLKGCRIDKTNKYLLYVSAISFLKLRRLQESLSQFDKILLQEPNQVVAINERSTVLLEMEQYDAALEGIQKAILLDPQFADAHLNKGVLCGQLGRYDEAIVAFQKALTLKPESANAWLGYGKSLFSLHRYDEALNAYGKALSLSSDLENAWLGRGNVLLDLKRFEEALGSYDKALALKPEWAEAWLGRGNVFTELKRYEEAFAAYDKALALKPNLENAWLGRGNILLEFNSIDRALADYQRALEIKKDIFAARVACCLAELQIIYADEHDVISRRTRYQKKLGALNDEVKAGNANGNCKGVFNSRLPFYLAYQGYNDRDLQRLYGSMVCQIMEREFPNLSLTQLAGPDEKIRIGFVSSFFYEHSNWKIPIKGWLGQLDRNRFKVFGYHVGKDRDSETDKAATMCDRFVQRIMSISDWREEILADAPHVLIYPGLFMDQISLQLAAQRLAPVQCNSWGHPDTSGMDTLDYYLSSDLMEPPDANEHYTEKLVRLPNLSIYYEPVPTEPLAISREELGLRQDALVFWCGQSLYKYLPQYDEVFARISESVENCQFVFIRHSGAEQITRIFQERLERAFELKNRKSSDHCVILPRLTRDQFFSAIGCCEIFLDSIGWSGCNSTLESLAHNLPIITMETPLMRGRHSAAILRMMGETETITKSVDEFVSVAIRLANRPDERKSVSQKIASSKHLLYRDRSCIEAFENFLDDVGRKRLS